MNKLGTGSNRETTAAILISANGVTGHFGKLGALSSPWDMGGPLDAPNVIPAGAMNNTEWTNGNGKALCRQNEFRRDYS